VCDQLCNVICSEKGVLVLTALASDATMATAGTRGDLSTAHPQQRDNHP
jgi:hypothetical protein